MVAIREENGKFTFEVGACDRASKRGRDLSKKKKDLEKKTEKKGKKEQVPSPFTFWDNAVCEEEEQPSTEDGSNRKEELDPKRLAEAEKRLAIIKRFESEQLEARDKAEKRIALKRAALEAKNASRRQQRIQTSPLHEVLDDEALPSEPDSPVGYRAESPDYNDKVATRIGSIRTRQQKAKPHLFAIKSDVDATEAGIEECEALPLEAKAALDVIDRDTASLAKKLLQSHEVDDVLDDWVLV